MRKTYSGRDIPTIGLSGSEIISIWLEGKIEIRANFTGQVIGFSVHKPSLEYYVGVGDGGEVVFKKSWKTSTGITVCDFATDVEMNEIEKELEAGSFQIVYASPLGVDSTYSIYVPVRKIVILHQADGTLLEKYRNNTKSI